MKAIQIVGTKFPKISYAFMSKIKPDPAKCIIDISENSSKNLIKIIFININEKLKVLLKKNFINLLLKEI